MLVRMKRRAKKLAVFQKYVRSASQLAAGESRSCHRSVGHVTPMAVRPRHSNRRFAHCYQSVADNLTNDSARARSQGQQENIFKKLWDVRVMFGGSAIAKRLLREIRPDEDHEWQRLLAGTLAHETLTKLGPNYSRTFERTKEFASHWAVTLQPLEKRRPTW